MSRSGTKFTESFPRTMRSGVFKGQYIASSTEYFAKMRAYRLQHPAKRRAAAKRASSVAKTIRAYELLRQEGIGQAKAARIIEELSE